MALVESYKDLGVRIVEPFSPFLYSSVIRMSFVPYISARHVHHPAGDQPAEQGDVVAGRSYQKYFFLGRMREGWCRLENPEADLAVTIRFSPDRVPYLGVWFNQGGWAGQYNIAPEPCTAAMDRVDLSRLWQAGSYIGPRETWEWELGLEVGSGAGSRQ